MLQPIRCDARCGRNAVVRVVASWGPRQSNILYACELHRLDMRKLAETIKREGATCKYLSEQRLMA
jgi:hypothetical protein